MSNARRRAAIVGFAVCALVTFRGARVRAQNADGGGIIPASVNNPPNYQILPVAFMDASHTRSDGFRKTDVLASNDFGQVIGNSNRYSLSSDRGLSTWFYDANSNVLTQTGM